MFALLANGGPPFTPAGAPVGERLVWGVCVSIAAVLGGWSVLNRNRPRRDTPVGVALLAAVILISAATLFAVGKNHARQMEHNRLEREARERGEHNSGLR